jgi:hypothetical protein
MTELENFKLLGITLAIGLLIGLERGWRTRNRDEGMRVAGLRTYGMIGLLGGLSGILAQEVDAFLMGFFFWASPRSCYWPIVKASINFQILVLPVLLPR